MLSSESDAFFKANMFGSFSEMGVSLKRIADDYIAKTNGSRTVTSIGTYAYLLSSASSVNLYRS